MSTIDRFRGPYFFLSNFYYVHVFLDGELYPSVEHAYQAAKTMDQEARLKIRNASSPSAAKHLGQKVNKRRDWEAVKVDVMEFLLRQKFSSDQPELRAKLIATGDVEIIEGNTWGDTFWGVCNDKGQNHLGKLLMQIREGIQK
jgi:ribA/ribD-fused uncharacterized protein